MFGQIKPFKSRSPKKAEQGPSPAKERVMAGNQTTDRWEETADSRISSGSDQLMSLVDDGESPEAIKRTGSSRAIEPPEISDKGITKSSKISKASVLMAMFIALLKSKSRRKIGFVSLALRTDNSETIETKASPASRNTQMGL